VTEEEEEEDDSIIMGDKATSMGMREESGAQR